MRPDGLPLLFSELTKKPDAPFRSLSNWGIDDFGHMVGTALWMWQGWFKPIDPEKLNIIQLPFALAPIKEGDKLINIRTKAEYTVKTVTHDARALRYGAPLIEGNTYSIPFPSRVIRKGFHPDALVGPTVEIAPASGDTIDLDPKAGDFLAIGSSKVVNFRQKNAELDDESSSGYAISWDIIRSEPGWGTEPFKGTKGVEPTGRPSTDVETDDPTVVARVTGQTFDNLIEFSLRAKSGGELSTLVAWFEHFMYLYSPIFQKEGFQRVVYWERVPLPDPQANKPGGSVGTRIRYFVRTEKLSSRKAPVLRKVVVETRLDAESGE